MARCALLLAAAAALVAASAGASASGLRAAGDAGACEQYFGTALEAFELAVSSDASSLRSVSVLQAGRKMDLYNVAVATVEDEEKVLAVVNTLKLGAKVCTCSPRVASTYSAAVPVDDPSVAAKCSSKSIDVHSAVSDAVAAAKDLAAARGSGAQGFLDRLTCATAVLTQFLSSATASSVPAQQRHWEHLTPRMFGCTAHHAHG